MNPIDLFLEEVNKERKYRKRAEVIIMDDDKIYVGYRNGKYMLPGGGIGSETPMDAAKREATEEIGINCVNLVQLKDPIKIKWPDIYGGENVKGDNKKWLEKEKLLGHINYTFRGDFSSISKSDSGPKDDKYPRKLIDPQEYIDQLKEDNQDPNIISWRKKWNNHTIECLTIVQKFLKGQI